MLRLLPQSVQQVHPGNARWEAGIVVRVVDAQGPALACVDNSHITAKTCQVNGSGQTSGTCADYQNVASVRAPALRFFQ